MDPQLIREFYQRQDCYQKVRLSPQLYEIGKTGLFMAEGQVWKQHRKLISNVFHFDFIKDKIPLMVNTSRELFDKIIEENKANGLKNIDLMTEIQKITGEILGRMFFGENLNQYKING